MCVTHVYGRFIDEAGQGLSGVQTTVCGATCFYGESDATGAFDVEVGYRIPLIEYSTLPHARPDKAGYYFPLPTDQTGPEIQTGDLRVLSLPASGPALIVKTDRAGAPEQSVTSGGVTLRVPAGVLVELDVEDVALGDVGKQFRVLEVDPQYWTELAPGVDGLLALYAFAPFDAAFVDEASGEPRDATLAVADAFGLPPGTALEILALGSYFQELRNVSSGRSAWVTPARFEPVATATVDADGSGVSLDSGAGLRYLSWVGIREAR